MPGPGNVAMPMIAASEPAPHTACGQISRSSRPATASSSSDAGICPTLSAVSAALTRSARPM
jgi:hypothetical protein